jgi:hypothetical protein
MISRCRGSFGCQNSSWLQRAPWKHNRILPSATQRSPGRCRTMAPAGPNVRAAGRSAWRERGHIRGITHLMIDFLHREFLVTHIACLHGQPSIRSIY